MSWKNDDDLAQFFVTKYIVQGMPQVAVLDILRRTYPEYSVTSAATMKRS